TRTSRSADPSGYSTSAARPLSSSLPAATPTPRRTTAPSRAASCRRKPRWLRKLPPSNTVTTMVLTKEELIASLQNEVRILAHLTGKVDRSKLDYRPTPKQRSTLELLQYMAIMGPTQVAVIKTGVFDRTALSAAWSPAEAAAKAMSFDQAVGAIQKQ